MTATAVAEPVRDAWAEFVANQRVIERCRWCGWSTAGLVSLAQGRVAFQLHPCHCTSTKGPARTEHRERDIGPA